LVVLVVAVVLGPRRADQDSRHGGESYRRPRGRRQGRADIAGDDRESSRPLPEAPKSSDTQAGATDKGRFATRAPAPRPAKNTAQSNRAVRNSRGRVDPGLIGASWPAGTGQTSGRSHAFTPAVCRARKVDVRKPLEAAS
jgi:hypothetical protein